MSSLLQSIASVLLYDKRRQVTPDLYLACLCSVHAFDTSSQMGLIHSEPIFRDKISHPIILDNIPSHNNSLQNAVHALWWSRTRCGDLHYICH